MSPDQAEKLIRSRIVVSPQKVTIAKAIVLDLAKGIVSSDELIAGVLRANAIVLPRPVVLHASVDSQAMAAAAGEALSWQLAATEAIWSLIHSGLLFALTESRGDTATVDWTTVVPGSGGMSSGWRFEECLLPVPGRVRPAPSLGGVGDQFLSEPDLYLNSLGVDVMHPEVRSAFREAVKCFRSELFTAALAMLGKASEGAWLELGEALLKMVPAGDGDKFARQRRTLEDPMLGVFRKMEAVINIYENQETFAVVSKSAGIRVQELRSVIVWSDAVRDSRNTIHFGVEPATPNTYEKLAALLIGAGPNVRILYSIKASADALA